MYVTPMMLACSESLFSLSLSPSLMSSSFPDPRKRKKKNHAQLSITSYNTQHRQILSLSLSKLTAAAWEQLASVAASTARRMGNGEKKKKTKEIGSSSSTGRCLLLVQAAASQACVSTTSLLDGTEKRRLGFFLPLFFFSSFLHI